MALLAKDPREFQLALAAFPESAYPESLAADLLMDSAQIPSDIRAWWIDEECDLPHDIGSEVEEVLSLANDMLRERGQANE